MKNRKTVLILSAACLLVLLASYGITYAWLIANDSEVNEFTVGENTIEVVEEFEPPEKLEPGVTFVKKPHVKNTGNLPCFVRMRADFSDGAAEAFCKPLEISDKWVLKDDGYYYYTELLAPGQDTPALFEKVTVKTEAEGATLNDMVDFDILIYAESCQHTDHDGACAAGEYYEVWRKETP